MGTPETEGLDRLLNSDSTTIVLLVVACIVLARVVWVQYTRNTLLNDRTADQAVEMAQAMQAATLAVQGMQTTLNAAIVVMERASKARENPH